jgi:sugar lactone lactonase YvrE
MNRETGDVRIIKDMWTDDERKDDGGGKPKVGKNKQERMRSNDGAVDAAGRFFVGTMNDPALVGENFTDEGRLAH